MQCNVKLFLFYFNYEYLVITRNYMLYLIVLSMHIFGLLVALGGYLVVNIIAISEYTEFCSYYPNCFNADVKVLNYIMFWLGVVCIMMLLFYIVFLPCYVMDVVNQYKQYRQRKKQPRQQQQQQQQHSQPPQLNDPVSHGILYGQNELN
jgi:predicted membrane protein